MFIEYKRRLDRYSLEVAVTHEDKERLAANAQLASRMRKWAQFEDQWDQWDQPSPTEAGERLRQLLGLAERLPRRPRNEPLTFPPIRR